MLKAYRIKIQWVLKIIKWSAQGLVHNKENRDPQNGLEDENKMKLSAILFLMYKLKHESYPVMLIQHYDQVIARIVCKYLCIWEKLVLCVNICKHMGFPSSISISQSLSLHPVKIDGTCVHKSLLIYWCNKIVNCLNTGMTRGRDRWRVIAKCPLCYDVP